MSIQSTSIRGPARPIEPYQRYLVSHPGPALATNVMGITGILVFAALQARLPHQAFLASIRDSPALTLAFGVIALVVFGPLCVGLVRLIPPGYSQLPPFATALSQTRWSRPAFVAGWAYTGTAIALLIALPARLALSASTADLSHTIPASSAPLPINAYHDPAAFVPLALALCGLAAGTVVGVRRSR